MAEGRSILITLDRERHLRFDFNALADLEQVLGVTLAQLPQDAGALGLRHVRAFVWAGLRHEDPQLTVAGAGDLLQMLVEGGGDLAALAEKLTAALALAGYGAQPGAAPSDPAPLAPTGSEPPST